jgi:hypothetical protein
VGDVDVSSVIQGRAARQYSYEFSITEPPCVVYNSAVTRADIDMWESELEDVFTRIRPLFSRTESKKHAELYFRGLLSPIERKNGWTIAELERTRSSR